MNALYNLLLSLSATFWMVVLYGIKEKWSIGALSTWMVGLLLLIIPVILSGLSLCIARKLATYSLHECEEVTLADNEFVPTYLGYFFAALSAPDRMTMIFLFGIVFAFTFLLKTQYFNPIYLLFGYHYYHIKTNGGTKVFAIIKGKVIRNCSDVNFKCLKRINDSTYLVIRREHNDDAYICKDTREGEGK